jgi:peptidyl-dipeptidase A
MEWILLPLVLALAPAPSSPAPEAPTAADAAAFVQGVEERLIGLLVDVERTNWVKDTNITFDTQILASQAISELLEYVAAKAKEARAFSDLALAPDIARKLTLLRISVPLAAPADAARRKELTDLFTRMDGMYSMAKVCPHGEANECYDLVQITDSLARSRNYDELLSLWQGWHDTAVPMKPMFARFVELANEGARELGFADTGEMWRSGYDMTPDQFAAETDRLWKQVEPLYRDLHCYARAKLGRIYGKDKVPQDGPIPAHLLGNMWAQEWNNLYSELAPDQGEALDLDALLKKAGYDEVKMVRTAEAFFVSLGLPPLPATFWERSMFLQPRDREVVCHASAWDVDWVDDIRIKMCIKVNGEDFTTIHHELGHNFYQRAYAGQPVLFRNSANDGFHEALGDTISLSVTPGYFVRIGLLDKEPPDSLNPLMARALEKIAFLPFGLLIDRWRWDVFAGKTPPERYNDAWWALRLKYQGVAPVGGRDAAAFDPGAKYHVPANVPYTRYFLASILQFQFHRGLCKAIGHKGPLHTCSIYGNREAGDRINRMMAMGLARPWPEALRELTGETEMDATAILEYFAPLQEWLEKQNRGRDCGW